MALVPIWFAPYVAVSELLFLAVSVLVAVLAFRVFRTSRNRLALSFGIGFSVLAISHLLSFFFHLLSLVSVVQCGVGFFSHCRVLAFTEWTRMIAALIAYALIAYVTLKPERLEPALLLIALSIGPLFVAPGLYGVIASVLLAYLTVVFALNAVQRGTVLASLVAIGFFGIFVSALITAMATHNLVAIVFHLLGYGAILANYLMVLQR